MFAQKLCSKRSNYLKVTAHVASNPVGAQILMCAQMVNISL